MYYEIRTYDLKPRSLPEVLKRFGEKIHVRQQFSQLGGFFYTEVGPLNQIIHMWPYEDLNQRTETRKKMLAPGTGWPPDTNEFIADMRSEIFVPAPFMKPLGERNIGPVYEMRIYTYPAGAIPKVIEAWSARIAEREKLSPLAGAMYSEIGKLNTWIHIWAYKSFDERLKIRREAQQKGIWPPPGGPAPLRQENKILLPADFSPMK